MASEYLTEGVNSLAPGNWKLSDGTSSGSPGFVNAATLVIGNGSTNITSDLDWSSLTNGVQSLKVTATFGGNVGAASTPLIVDASDSSAAVEWTTAVPTEARIEHSGTGALYVRGDNYGIDNLQQNGNGTTVLINGTAAYTRVQRGKFQAESLATVTTFNAMGGTSVLGTKSSAGTLANVWNGSHTTQRPFTTMNIYGGTWIINVSNAGAASTINQHGGTVILLAHGTTAITAYNHYAGVFDPTRLRVDTIITTYTRQEGAVYAGSPNGATLTLTNSIRKDNNVPAI